MGFCLYICICLFVFRHLKEDAFTFSVVEITATFLSQHWLTDISLFFRSEVMIEDPSAVVAILDDAIFRVDDHIGSAESKEGCENHNKFHIVSYYAF